MKKLIIIFLLLITCSGFAQIDTASWALQRDGLGHYSMLTNRVTFAGIGAGYIRTPLILSLSEIDTSTFQLIRDGYGNYSVAINKASLYGIDSGKIRIGIAYDVSEIRLNEANTWTGTQTFPIVNLNQIYTVGKLRFYNAINENSFNINIDSLAHYNTYIGLGAGDSNTVAKFNTALGYNALNKTQSGWSNTAIGYGVLSNGVGTGNLTISGTGVEFYANTGVGQNCLTLVTTGSYNSALGVNSLTNLTTGYDNTSVGVHSSNDMTEGLRNNSYGRGSLYKTTTGDDNTAIGFQSLFYNVTGSMKTGVGVESGLNDISPNGNSYLGYRSGYRQSSGSYNTIIGQESGYGSGVNRYWYNSTLGYQSLYSIGADAEGNVALGYKAGYRGTTSQYSIWIGGNSGTDARQLVNPTNSIAIGRNTYTTASYQVVIGDSTMTSFYLNQLGTGRLYLRNLDADTVKTDIVLSRDIKVDSTLSGTTNLRGQDAFNSTDLTDTVAVANASINDIYFITLTGQVAGVDETPYVEATATGFIVRRNTGTTSGLTYNWLRIK